MIEFTSIDLKNFTSFKSGNLAYKRGLTLVEGDNRDSHGADSNMAGKTNLITEALLWGLYGEGTKQKTPEGKNVQSFRASDVIYRTESKCEVIIGFKAWGNPYVVERSRTRSGSVSLKVFGDRKFQGKSKTETQKMLTELLGVSYASFVQAVVMGQGSKRFSQAKDSERKQILEEILDLGLYESSLQRVRKDKKALTEEIRTLSTDLSWMEDLLLTRKNRVEDEKIRYKRQLEAQESWENGHRIRVKQEKAKLDDLEDQVSKKRKKIKQQKELVAWWKSKLPEEDPGELVTICRDRMAVADAKLGSCIEAVDAVLSVEDAPECPTCGQEIDWNDLQDLTYKREQARDDAQDESTRCHKDLMESLEIVKEADKIESLFRTSKLDLKAVKRDLVWLKKERKRQRENYQFTKDEKPPVSIAPDKSLLKEAVKEQKKQEKKIAKATKKISKLTSQLEDLKFLDTAFGKKGIRSLVIDSIVPHLNKIANEYIGKVTDGLEVEFNSQSYTSSGKAQEVLDLKIIGPGGEGYHLGSGGERRRVDFCVALALQSLLVSMGSSCNLFVLDEPFESVDGAGVEGLLELLREYAMEKNVCIYCVTHLPSLKPLFDNVVTVRKKHGVSKVVS